MVMDDLPVGNTDDTREYAREVWKLLRTTGFESYHEKYIERKFKNLRK
jgi:hypothetical protein